MNIRRSCKIIVTGLACVVAAQAQTSQTTGAIRGVIKNKQGGTVAGAAIQARNMENGFTRSATTNASGQYTMSMMPVGEYELTVTAADLKTLKKDHLIVTLGEVTPLNFTMDKSAATAVVEVFAEISNVDSTQTNSSSTISTEMVAAIPVNGRNFTDLAQLTPGANTGAQDYRTVIEGARGVQNSLQIDGASFNSRFSGESRGGTRVPYAFGMGSIRELQVITNPFDCQYGDANGAVINAITKSGNNEVAGEVMALFRPQWGVAKIKDVPYDPKNAINVPLVQDRKFTRSTYAFNIGGPIIKDKLHYFVNAERATFSMVSAPSVSYDSTGGTGPDFDNFWNGPAKTLITGGNGMTLAQEKNNPWTNKSTNLAVMMRLDWTINSNHRANLRVNSQEYKGTNDIWSGSQKINEAESNNSSSKYGSMSWVLELNSTIGNNINNEARVQFSNERRPWTPNSTVAEIGVPGFYAGQSYLDPRDTDESLTQVIDTLSYFSGDWTLKAGINFQDINYRNQFLQNQGGALVFTNWSIANAWFGSRLDTVPSGQLTYSGATSNSAGWAIYGQKVATIFTQGEYAGLWEKRIKLTFGARFTRETWQDNPRPNPMVQGLDHMPDNSTLDPRFGFSIDLFGDSKTVIRGGLGAFSMPNLGQAVASTFLQNGQNSLPYKISATDHGDLFKGEGPFSYSTMVKNNRLVKTTDEMLTYLKNSGQTTNSISVTLIDPEAKMTQRQTATLGFEQDLGKGFTFGMAGTYSRFIHSQYWQNINLGQKAPGSSAVDTTAYYNDGYKYRNNAFNTGTRPGRATVRGRQLDLNGFGDVQVAMFNGRARYRSIKFELNRKGGADQFGFMFNASFNRSEDNNTNENATAQSVSGNPQDPSNPLAMARGDNDQACRINFTGYTPRFAGFRMGGVFSWSTGLPFTPKYSTDVNGDGYNNNDAALGGRNSARLPSRKTLSFNVSRAFKLTRKVELNTEVQVYNPFNWANQSTTLQSVYSGPQSTTTPIPEYRKINTFDAKTREIQFQARLTF